MKAKRRLLFQILAVVLLVAIGYTMTIIGRGHTIYLDSKTLEYDGQTYKPAYKTVVYVDGQQVAKLYDKERGVDLYWPDADRDAGDHPAEGRNGRGLRL